MSKRILYRLLWIPSLFAVIALALYYSNGPIHLPEPGKFVTFVTSDGMVRLQHPANWKVHTLSLHAVEEDLDIAPMRNTRFLVHVDLQGSLIAQMMSSADSQLGQIASMVPGAENPLKNMKSPLERLHDLQAAKMIKDKDTYVHYVDGKTVHGQIGHRDALITDCSWESPGIFGTKQPIVGRRISCLAQDHEVSIIYYCLVDTAAAAMPTFNRMVDSVLVDSAGGAR